MFRSGGLAPSLPPSIPLVHRAGGFGEATLPSIWDIRAGGGRLEPFAQFRNSAQIES
jgi:hypothetical protein